MQSNAQKRPLGLQIAIYTFAGLWLLMAAFPFVWTVWGSFKVELDFFSIADWTYAITGERTKAEYGRPFTGAGYEGAWIKEEFWRNAINTFIVCFFVVCTSLTIGTLGGYALSRSAYKYTFFLLITALIFRAMPPVNGTFGASCQQPLLFWSPSISHSHFGCCIRFSKAFPKNLMKAPRWMDAHNSKPSVMSSFL